MVHRTDPDLAVLLLVVKITDLDQTALGGLAQDVSEAGRRDRAFAAVLRHLSVPVEQVVQGGDNDGPVLDRSDVHLLLPVRP
ncbi:hypothetical protein [Bradyrhizobium sp. CCBAU 25360]|uniref:hypothetical protein n=1 Tax=Bradyrhizobium sp. CCBAU 25360 TaxID=858425 RepID=UPI002306A622|nr:hypothetical protein [Bradyrhizobium sp. CCBAU 25360]